MNSTELIRKFNIPGPRYTSYPTVPYWSGDGISNDEWIHSLNMSFVDSYEEGISLYIHLPFCESLCTFCGCHKRITRNHGMETPYIYSLLQEWELYLKYLPVIPKIREIHLGGGTPTFFSPDNLKELINGLIEPVELHGDYQFSFEGHPNNTGKEHLQALYDLGFRRVSYGVQDYDPIVQKSINRIQLFEQVKKVHRWSQEIGYTSINHDLVYGLPHQNLDSVKDTMDKTRALNPDRIAFYSYAHVPWIKGVGQRGFDEADLPQDEEKRALYEFGKMKLEELNYREIGMDHFALSSDSLFHAMESGTLHRNFMGYTTNHTKVMIGLGMSSISDSWYGFVQNEKKLEAYQKRVSECEIPLFRGHLLDEEDLMIREHILDLMCRFETVFEGTQDYFEFIREGLTELESYGLVRVNGREVTVPKSGVPFIRNICMAFDVRLRRSKPDKPLFSSTI